MITKFPDEQFKGYFAESSDGTYAHKAELFVGLLADAGYFFDGEGGKEGFF